MNEFELILRNPYTPLTVTQAINLLLRIDFVDSVVVSGTTINGLALTVSYPSGTALNAVAQPAFTLLGAMGLTPYLPGWTS